MACPADISEEECEILGKSVAIRYFMSKVPATEYDNETVVIVSATEIRPDCLKEHHSQREIGVSLRGEGRWTRPACFLKYGPTKQNGRTTAAANVIIDFLRLNHILRPIINDDLKKVVMSSLKSTLMKLLDQSNIQLIEYYGDNDKLINDIEKCLKMAANRRAKAESKDNEDVSEVDPISHEPNVSMNNIGAGLAMLYVDEHFQPVLSGMKGRINKAKGRDLDLDLVPLLVIDCSKDGCSLDSDELRSYGWIGTVVDAKDEEEEVDGVNRSVKSAIYQFELDAKNYRVVVDYPEPLVTLKTMQNEGKLSDREYEREFDKFLTALDAILEKKSLDDVTKNQFTVYSGVDRNVTILQHIQNVMLEKNLFKKGIRLEDDEDIETDDGTQTEAPPTFPPLSGKESEKEISSSHLLQSSDISTLDIRSDFFKHRRTNDVIVITEVVSEVSEFEELNWCFVDRSDPESTPAAKKNDVAVLPLTSNMVLAALKQENLISDLTQSRLTASSSDLRHRYTPHHRASFVLELLLFIVTLNSVKYADVLRSIEGLRQRARSSSLQLDGGTSGERGVTQAAAEAEEEENQTVVSERSHVDKDVGGEEEKASKPPAKEMTSEETRVQIASNVLFTMIADKKYLPYDFEVQLRKLALELKQDASKLRSRDGMTLLHAAVAENRPQFLLPLFRLGCWSSIRLLKVDGGRGSSYEGKTADDICTSLRYRKVQKEMDTYVTWEKSMNVIHLAARRGDIVDVRRFCKLSEEAPLEPDSMECTTLYWAVVGGDVDVVKFLLGRGVDPAKLNSRKESLLHAACMLGHRHLLTTLVKDLKMDATSKDSAKKSPLLRVAENGDERSLAKLMKCGLQRQLLGPVLAIAGHYGRLGFIRKVVEEYSIDPASRDDAGKTAFMRACEQSRIDVARYLISKGIDVGEKDIRRRNVLHMAADAATKELVEFLVEEMKKKEKTEGRVLLKGLINQKDKYIGGELCMLIRGKDKGRDSWHYVEVSRGLMDVFMKRTRSGTIDVARYGTLLHSGWGADPDDESAREIERRFETRRNATSSSEALDVTPLHIAAFKDKPDVAEVLMDNGADLNAEDKFGLTPLHVAAMRGNMALVRSMLRRGARTDKLDHLVKTPSDVADDNEHKEASTCIRSYQYIPVAQKFRDTVLPRVQQVLSEENIQGVMENGRDLRTLLINTLRELTVDINETLLDLGSGPVLEESTPSSMSDRNIHA